MLVQLGTFFAKAVHFDFGESLWQGGSAIGSVLAHLPATLLIAIPAVVLGAAAGLVLGTVAARRPDSGLAQALNVFAYGVISVAEFWVGLMLILIFAVIMGWLPTGGYDPKPATLVLPVLVLAMKPFAQIFQLTQSTMVTEYGKQYVMAARAKGLGEVAVAREHVIRNAAIPVVTLGFYELGRVFVGTAVIVEVVFAWPGIGRLAVGALEHGDVFLVQAIVAVAAIVVAGLNLGADLLYFRLDPRTRSVLKGGS
ncbi:ABC transporter permease [Pseudonocardia sulfidoxydans]|uniref:ABC transporter permease n=1 Tax=Pseudonocardia sulfidoxydans TaxID=54011 RepID=UPI00361BD3D1